MRNTEYFADMIEIKPRMGFNYNGKMFWPIASFTCENTAYSESGEPFFVIEDFDLVWDSNTTNYLLFCVTDEDESTRRIASVTPKVVGDFFDESIIF